MVNCRRPFRETPLGPGAKKDGCFCRLDRQLKKEKLQGYLSVKSFFEIWNYCNELVLNYLIRLIRHV